jgi:hypothetical protein
VASQDELARQKATRDRQHTAFLHKIYELSHADPEKDISYEDIVTALDMDSDACRIAKLSLEGQAFIHTTQEAVNGLIIDLSASQSETQPETQQTLINPTDDLLRITHKGILKVERDLDNRSKPPPQQSHG